MWIVLDHFFDWRTMGDDIAKRPWITVGVAALALAGPLAATSTTGMIKRLGGVAWRRLHRLAYVAAVLGCLHYIWLAKKVLMAPKVYAGVLGAAARDPRVGRRAPIPAPARGRPSRSC